MGQSSSRQDASASSQRSQRPRSYIFAPDTGSTPRSQDRASRRRSILLPSFTARTDQEAWNDYDSSGQAGERRRSRLLRAPTALRSSFRTVLGRHESSTNTATSSPRHDLPMEPQDRRTAIPSPSSSSPPQLDMPVIDEPLDIPPLRRARPLSELTPRPMTSELNNGHNEGTVNDRHGSTNSSRPRPVSLPPQPLVPSFSRRSLRRGGDPDDVLSTILHHAAEATAMTMRGRRGVGDRSSLANDGTINEGEESFNGFLQSLRNGRLARQLSEQGSARGDPSHMEFLRMFRFESNMDNTTEPPSPSTSLESQPSNQSLDSANDRPDRLVPILIVGVRAMDADWTASHARNSRSFFDRYTPDAADARDADRSRSPPRAQREAPHERNPAWRRSSSVGRFNLISRARDSRRQHESSRPATSQALSSESPPGPHPPPTTPASPGMSAVSSGINTPSRGASVSTVGDTVGARSRRSSLYRRLTGATLQPTREEQHPEDAEPPYEEMSPRPQGLRRRPPINSRADGVRHDTRRDGVLMEPSSETPNERSSTRSWIIYILGGNYPENHPLLATPSLFTDNPSYEDMLLLSNLLGPGKPPVAKPEEVARAGGIFNLRTVDQVLRAQPKDGGAQLDLTTEDQCQVCLCGYADGEETRRLAACKHIFHRACIDEWLTTGRNSCPLCRTQGVKEQADSNHDSAQQPYATT